jgi:hypothetical protein
MYQLFLWRLYLMVLRGATSLLGALEGVGPENLDFFSGLWIRINFFRIRIQSLMLETNTDPDPDPIRIQGFNDQKSKKNYS